MMKKIIATTICFLFVFTLIAQKGIEGLIQAEKNFAAYSLAHSTKEAFQQFIDSNSIMFDNGKPVKAIEFWNKKEKNAGVLNWWPQYAEISASGDFGYTTGPWTFQQTKNDSIAARGQYTTVWHIDKNGEWKFLVDLGINNTQNKTAGDIIRFNTTKHSEDSTTVPSIFPMLAAEGVFLNLFAKNKSKAYKKYLSIESILNRNGFLPAVSAAGKRNIINTTSSIELFVLQGWGVSPVADMGYTYGSTTIKGKTENYLHIWRKEEPGWKIAVEILRY
jgi:ketosteroid isomerase-like protein